MLDKVYDFLDENTIFGHLYNLPSEIETLISDCTLTKTEQEIVNIEKVIFYTAGDITTSRKKYMDNAYEIIDKHLDYIEARLTKTRNFALKGVYSEILFYSTDKKYKKYVGTAADSYLLLLKDFHKRLSKNEDNLFVIKQLAEKTLHLTLLANRRIKETKEEIKSIITTSLKLGIKYAPLIIMLIKLMLEYKNIFRKQEFLGIDDIFWEVVKQKKKEKDYEYITLTIDLGLEIDKKLGKLSYPWIEEKCKCYELIIKQETKPIRACSMCIDAIENYKSIDIISKHIQNIEKIYTSLKDKIIFPSNFTKVDVTAFVKHAEDILKYNPIQIFHYLAFSKKLFPDKTLLEKRYSFLTDIIPLVYLDHNSHPAKRANNEILNDLYLSNYRNMWFLYERTVQYIIIEGVKIGKLNLQYLIGYLLDHSCFFDLQTKIYAGEEKIKYNWSSSIIRIFETYFNEINLAYSDAKKRYPHLIEITDSLVLKFEAFLRLILEKHKQPTLTSKTKETHVVREKDINALLYDNYLAKVFTFEDILFFRYLFVAKEGLNLRNDIAHSLLLPEQYTVELFNLVFFAFLRLSKYNIPNKNSNKFKKTKPIK